jgi:hypothetical protein
MRPLTTLSRSLLALLAYTTLASATDPKYASTLILSYEFVSSSSPKPSPLATINYDPKTLRYNLVSWTPPSTDTLQKSTSKEPPTSAPLLRILTPTGSSTVTTLSTFSTDLKQHLNLYLSTNGQDLLSASLTSITPTPLTDEEARYRKKVERAKARGKPIPKPPKPEKPKKPKKGSTAAAPVVAEQQQSVFDDTPEGQPRVNLVVEQQAPKPKLMSRAPPVLDASGNEVVAPEAQEKTFFQKYWWVFLIGLVLTMGGGGGGDK